MKITIYLFGSRSARRVFLRVWIKLETCPCWFHSNGQDCQSFFSRYSWLHLRKQQQHSPAIKYRQLRRLIWGLNSNFLLACSAGVLSLSAQFTRESATSRSEEEMGRVKSILFLLSPIFLCHKIKDGGYNNITNTNKVSPTQNTPALQSKWSVSTDSETTELRARKNEWN